MSMNEKELIKNFLLENEEERKERFEIAYDIWANLWFTKRFLKENLIDKVEKRIKKYENFSVVKPESFWEKGYDHILVAKGGEDKNWFVSTNLKQGILSFCLEYNLDSKKPLPLWMGIVNFDRNKGIPFKGSIKEIESNNEILKKARMIYDSFRKCFNGKGESTDGWVAFLKLDSLWDDTKEFYLEILSEEGMEGVAENIFQEFEKMRKATETLIDEFVEIYREETIKKPIIG